MRKRPACMATGVSSRPSAITSPIAYTHGVDVDCSLLSATIFLFLKAMRSMNNEETSKSSLRITHNASRIAVDIVGLRVAANCHNAGVKFIANHFACISPLISIARSCHNVLLALAASTRTLPFSSRVKFVGTNSRWNLMP